MDNRINDILKFCCVACICIFSFLIVRAEPEDSSLIKGANYILVGSEYSYPPYCFVDEEGKAAGFLAPSPTKKLPSIWKNSITLCWTNEKLC